MKAPQTLSSLQPDPGVQAASDSGPAGRQSPPALKVLIVEDLPRVQALLRELVQEPGRIEITGVAETEADAIEQYRATQPDAVLIDLNLRVGTGLGVIMALRRGESPRRPLLVVLTNHALPVLETACLNAGADHFLDKSRDFHKVRGLLEEAWRRGSGAIN